MVITENAVRQVYACLRN